MTEIVLAILLAVAGGVGALLWRKAAQADAHARQRVDAWRQDAREANAVREDTIAANIEAIDHKVEAIGDDRAGRQHLADLLNDD